jgi:predicted enzyme related to lactoylglutathione lyase
MARLIHLEFAGKDGHGLREFLAQLFQFELPQDGDLAYWKQDLATHDKPMVGVRHEPEGCNEIVPYFAVHDVDVLVTRAEELGGTLRVPAMDWKGTRFAVIADPEGNAIGLIGDQ